MDWLLHCIVQVIGFPENLPNDSSQRIMMLAKFWDRYEINWSMKLEISSTLEVNSVNGVVGALHSSRYWISLKNHQMTPPTIL